MCSLPSLAGLVTLLLHTVLMPSLPRLTGLRPTRAQVVDLLRLSMFWAQQQHQCRRQAPSAPMQGSIGGALCDCAASVCVLQGALVLLEAGGPRLRRITGLVPGNAGARVRGPCMHARKHDSGNAKAQGVSSFGLLCCATGHGV
jgi:hypothetical protein